ncbi:DUF262 domain-containing protein [Kocuria rosea]|uniref:DUF262 domain-containing protein n=1 Tax=Kocuria rosea TaxID=1275 RepID=UPI0015F06F08|nr:DUF262 domain-containing protein [Kocuria rosea]
MPSRFGGASGPISTASAPLVLRILEDKRAPWQKFRDSILNQRNDACNHQARHTITAPIRPSPEGEPVQIDAHKRTLGEVLQQGQHIIPRYQRRYAWESQHIKDFWGDITNAKEPHFLGSMVTSGAMSAPREVIDGQQRLTTTIISLCVLRDHYEEIDQENRVKGINEYLEFNDRNGDRRTRLKNRDQTAANRLNDNVLLKPARRLGCPSYDPQSHEAQAYEVFNNLARAALEQTEEKVECLDEIRDAILESEVVYINVEDRKNAFTIFETLNDRGKSLTVMDLVKNLLFSEISDGDEDSSERIWSEILEIIDLLTFEGISPDNFLYYAWNSRDHVGHNKPDTIENARIRRSIAEQIGASKDRDQASQDLVSNLKVDASLLAALNQVLTSNAGTECWRSFDEHWRRDKYEDISSRVYGILVTGSNQPIPLLLALMRSYYSSSQRISRKILLSFLTYVENFQFRWTIAQKSSTSSIRRLYRQGAASVSAATSANAYKAAMEAFVSGASNIDASDTQFRDGIGRLAYSRTRIKDSYKVRYILTQIEKSYGSTKLDLSRQMSIEHLQGLEGRSEQTPRNAWIFKIGNLAIIPPEVNASLPRDFSDKCEELNKWVSPDDQELVAALTKREWKSETAGKRLDLITQHALTLWPKLKL